MLTATNDDAAGGVATSHGVTVTKPLPARKRKRARRRN
jgi:hypothetical protein